MSAGPKSPRDAARLERGNATMMPIVVLFVGVFACSTSVIFIKRSQIDPALLSALRLLLAAALLMPLFVRARRQHRELWRWADARRSIWPALALAAHFILWVIGARGTLAANASLIVNMAPLAMPFFLLPIAHERIRRADLLGTVLGVAGVLALSASDVSVDRGYLAGDLNCFAAMLLFALYLALGRRNRFVPSIWLYMVPLYTMAGVLCLLYGLVRNGGFGYPALREWGYALALAVVPTIFGHSLLNLALKKLPGATVSICNLAQFVFATGLGWILFGEVPRPAFWLASALIVAGAVIALRGAPDSEARATVEEA